MRMRLSLCAAAFVLACSSARAQSCVNINTGFDQDADAIIGGDLDILADDDYTIDTPDGALGGVPAYTVMKDGFPIPPWIDNDAKSRWIGFDNNDSEADAGNYLYTIAFIMPAAIDASKAVIIGGWATDDGGLDVIINGNTTGFGAAGFGGLTKFPANFGVGFFVPGLNTIDFELNNGGGPTGLRVSACVGVPVVSDRLVDLSTGFDETTKILLGDGALDDDYDCTGPAGSGIAGRATCIVDDDFPIPPWIANSVNSRWIGPAAADAVGPGGSYTFKTTCVVPAAIDIALAEMKGTFSSPGSVDDILVNGKSIGLTGGGDPTKTTSFPIGAGQGLFKRLGINTVEFLVTNPVDGGSIGLRVDAEVVQGKPPIDPPAAVLHIDTGFDDAAGALLGDLVPDDNYVVIGPPDSDVGPEYATTVAEDGYPIPPWIANTCESRWIGLNAADSSGPGGTYIYLVKVNIPAGFDASQARLVGGWATDDPGTDIVINGTPTGLTAGGFGGLTAFPPDAGLGLFESGDNEIQFLVLNGGGPTGLRVEGVVGFGDPRPGDISTGVDARGVGLLPGGVADPRYIVTGPGGAGIGPRPSIVVPADGNPIPPWLADTDLSQWVGLDGNDSVGPAGEYTYELKFCVPATVNATRLSIQGSWAAAGSGTDVVLNGTSLGATTPGATALTAFPPKLGQGLVVPGENVLQFKVSNPAPGSTGLRVEASPAVFIGRNPLDISTGFDQVNGTALFEGDSDDDYTVTDVINGSNQATVLIGSPIPPWVPQTDSSRWIGTANVNAAPGSYAYEIQVVLTAEQAAGAFIQGGWAVDDTGVELAINDVATGITNNGAFVAYTPFPPDAGKGLFQQGANVIRFTVENGGTAENPSGLRVDAEVVIGSTLPAEICDNLVDDDGDADIDCADSDCAAFPACAGVVFHRGDADDNGELQLTDAIKVLGYLFLGSEAPTCLDAGDADDNGELQLTDAIRILGYLFLGQPAPPDPGPTDLPCGPDPTADPAGDLGCASYTHCN